MRLYARRRQLSYMIANVCALVVVYYVCLWPNEERSEDMRALFFLSRMGVSTQQVAFQALYLPVGWAHAHIHGTHTHTHALVQHAAIQLCVMAKATAAAAPAVRASVVHHQSCLCVFVCIILDAMWQRVYHKTHTHHITQTNDNIWTRDIECNISVLLLCYSATFWATAISGSDSFIYIYIFFSFCILLIAT